MTGSSRGIGRAIARVLAARGAAVCINYATHTAEAEAAAGEIAAARGRVIAIQADVAGADAVNRMVARTEAEFGPVGTLGYGVTGYRDGVTGYRPKRAIIAHVSIGVRDIDQSRAFYGATLAPLGYRCIRAARSLVGYGYGADSISFWVFSAEHPVPPDEKSGLHFCFAAPDAAAVDAFHAAA